MTHFVSEKYLVTASERAGVTPFLVPALAHHVPVEEILARFDGILLTGSRSNVEPHHYGAEKVPDLAHDPARDAVTLPLIRAAVAADLPIVAICRGIQELNAAMGGTLHQQVQAVPGRLDHRAPKRDTMPERYDHSAHPVTLTPGGLFERWAGAGEIVVNSLHQQGIDQLAPGFTVEAVAPDQQIEGISRPGNGFVIGVQWHPEFRASDTRFGRNLFEAFG
ncbi:MAG TPA: gamma-glutamyl-gamma-aminobutyrate hydrolase family protein, partial [Stellaceae bacterium]|nr:gamma-glutamyl-gamma-aminobutyrate hydrolase family protein [Stellaceae bacterium]